MREKFESIRLVTLNTWCGRSLYPLMDFFRRMADKADVFCLQEVRDTDQQIVDRDHPDQYLCGPLFSKIAAKLPGFSGWFATFEGKPQGMSQAIFVRRGIEVKAVGDVVVYEPAVPKETGNKVFSARKLQHMTLRTPRGDVLIANCHGLWNAGPKTDTPERLEQSRRIREFLDSRPGSKILCGDFNLLPDTRSLKMLEEGMCNLVKHRNILSTRTVLYRHYDNPAEPNFADYILVSPEVVFESFRVLPDVVSDHSPLYMEFHLASEHRYGSPEDDNEYPGCPCCD